MTRLTASVALVIGVLTISSRAAMAQEAQPLPSPLSLSDVIRIAAERRDELQAARARTTAGEARPTIVSALSDPMLSPSLDHLPFMLNGADVSVTIEQQIPLSGIRGHRRASALADVDRLRAETRRTTLEVSVEAANAYLMLQERRRTAALVTEQIAFARALVGEVRGAEAMLNTSLAIDADVPVPPLRTLALPETVPSWMAIKSALTSRPQARGPAGPKWLEPRPTCR
jgi:hypothetical protein